MSPLRLAWLNLARHKAATVLTVVSLALTVACTGVLLRTWQVAGSRFGSMVRAGDALVGAKADPVDMALGAFNLEGPYPGFIPLRLYFTLLREPWRAGDQPFSMHIVPLVFCGKYRGHRVLGTTADLLHQPAPSPDLSLASGAWPDTAPAVILGAGVARREGLRVGDVVPVEPWASDVPAPGARARFLRVAGVLRPMGNAWDGALFTNLLQAENLIAQVTPSLHGGAWDDLVLNYLVIHFPPRGMEALRALINQRTVAQAAPVPEILATLERLTATGRALGMAVAALALCLTGVAVSALMLGRFEGLARQMAVLEALGFRRRALCALLAWEGLLLGAGAVLLGAALDGLLFPVLRYLLSGTLPGPEAAASPVWNSWPVWALALPGMVLASVLSSLFVFRGRARERLRGLA